MLGLDFRTAPISLSLLARKALNLPELTMTLPKLDLLDFQIFRSMRFSPSAGDLNMLDPWSIGRQLGVDGKTVKLRIRKMEKQGFIKYYQIYPNYKLLAVEGEAAYIFEASELQEKYEAIEKARLIDGVVGIFNFIGNAFCVEFTYRDARDHDKRLALIKELTRYNFCTRFSENTPPPPNIELNSLDWSIIRSLRYNALKRLSKVAEDLGVGMKTVKRRFHRMATNRAFIISPIINPGAVPNTISYALAFFIAEEERQETVRNIREAFSKTCFLAYTPLSGGIVLLNFANTLGETEDALLMAKSMRGVEEVRLYVLKEIREYSDWMDREIQKRIEKSSIVSSEPTAR